MDQYVAGTNPLTGKHPDGGATSWALARQSTPTAFFVVCANVLGGCMGSTGPKDINPATGRPWGLKFPVITIRDMVQAQAALLDHLGVKQVFCVVGGSMGAMQVMEWAHRFPERVFAAVPIAGSYRHSAQNIAFHEVGRQAIAADPDWRHGEYLEQGTLPKRGLAVARMVAHITYLSETARCIGNSGGVCKTATHAHLWLRCRLPSGKLPARHQGYTFVDRFDPNFLISTSRARWTTSILPKKTAACCRMRSRGHAGAFLPHLVLVRLAVPQHQKAARLPTL